MGTPRKNPAGITDDVVQQCLGMVELALRRGSREEALAAVARAFAAVAQPNVDLRDGSLHELGLDFKTVSILAANRIETIGQLSTHTSDELLAIRQIGKGTVDLIESRLAAAGLRLRKAVQKVP